MSAREVVNMNRRVFLGSLVALAVAPKAMPGIGDVGGITHSGNIWKFRDPYHCGYFDQMSPGARRLHAEWKRRVASGEIIPFSGFNNIKR